MAHAGGRYGQGQPTQNIYAVNLMCNGTEERVIDCASSGTTCTHTNDAGLDCNATCK